MKHSEVEIVDVESTFQVLEDIEMTIDPTKMAHLMHLLTNMYGDEELAIIREYATNAWDAHVEAGNTDTPIEVTTPTRLTPNLVIKDYGVGMDATDIRNVYSRYGTSTKNDTDEQNGRMGIGGKSALAYTNQFTVVGTKDGIRTTVIVSRNPDGGGSMQIIGKAETDDNNGVEVIVPAKPYNNIREKAKNLFRFWDKGTVLLDDEDPHLELRKVSDHIYAMPESEELDHDIIVMGNVAYPLDSSHAFSMGSTKHVAFVSMDQSERVFYTPAREGLIYNSETMRTIEMLTEEFQRYILDYVNKLIDETDTHYEAYSLRNDILKKYDLDNDFKYKGMQIPGTQERAYDDGPFTRWNLGRYRNAVDSYRNHHINFESFDSARLIVTEYPGTSGVSGAHKKRIKEYVRTQFGVSYFRWEYVYFFGKGITPDFTWVDETKIVDWKTILETTRDPREYNGGGKGSRGGTGSDAYSYRDKDGSHTGMPPEDAHVYYYSSAHTYAPWETTKMLFKKDKKAVIINASANRHAKIKRIWPNAKLFEPYVLDREFAKAAFDKISDKDMTSIKVYFCYRRVLDYRDREYAEGIYNNRAKILDKGLTKVFTDFHNAEKVYQKYIDEYAAKDSRWHQISYTEIDAPFDFNVYPLRDWRRMGDTIEYINALYKCRNNKKDKS